MYGMFKRFYSVGVIFILIFTFAISGSFCFADSAALDIVLVIDDTASMQRTDPQRLSALAIRKFIDKLPNENVETAVGAYSISVENGALPLKQYSKEELKAFANNNLTRGGSGTDAAAGLKWAAEQLNQQKDNGHRKAIILIGDGENDLRVYSNGKQVRTQAMSDADLKSSVDQAKAAGYPIYTLAINPPTEQFRSYFADIAGKTGGIAYTPTTADEIDTILNEVFSEITGVGVGGGTFEVAKDKTFEQKIQVPAGVFEWNLQLEHKQVVDISFEAPDGTIIDKNASGMLFSQESAYTNCKIFEPQEGSWTVRIRSEVTQEIPYSLVFHSDIAVELTADLRSIYAKEKNVYQALLKSKGTDITDKGVLENLQGALIVQNTESGEKKETKMNAEEGGFTANYALPGEGRFEIWVKISGNDFELLSNTLKIDAVENPDRFPIWKVIGGAAGLLALIILGFVGKKAMKEKPGGGEVPGKITVRLRATDAEGNTEVFESKQFSSAAVFQNRGTLADLLQSYVRWYKGIHPDSMSLEGCDLFFDYELFEAAKGIEFSGTRSGKCKVTAAAKPNVQLEYDGCEIKNTASYLYTDDQRDIELKMELTNGKKYSVRMKIVVERM